MVFGKDSLSALERLCTAKMDCPVGSCVYSLMLNKNGGIEADLVATRMDKDTFYLTVGSATTRYVMRHIWKNVPKNIKSINVKDVTEDLGIISLQGPYSAALLQKITSEPLDASSFPWSTSKKLQLSGCSVDVCRLTYVGEPGYELHAKASDCKNILGSLLKAKPDLTFAGSDAMDSMSMERGFIHWHGDVDCTDTAVEAGLGFTCKKEQDYIGKSCVERQKKEGLMRRLTCFTIADQAVGLHGNEAVYRNGDLMGYFVRSGNAYTGERRGIGFAYVKNSRGGKGEKIDKKFIADAEYEVSVRGLKVPATVHTSPLVRKMFK
jgi:sarcosine dehydrogenase